jgi:hypothetical protein
MMNTIFTPLLTKRKSHEKDKNKTDDRLSLIDY